MPLARDLMTPDVAYVQAGETLDNVARMMRDSGVGALPVCADDAQLVGMVTDRDIVVHCIAEGHDPAQVRVESLAGGRPVTIGADDDTDQALLTMVENGVRRLPVIDGHRLVGILAQADVARVLPEDKAGELIGALSTAPSNN